MTTELVDLPPRFGMDRPAFDRLGSRPPGELRLASTVVLLRDAAARSGIEVFLLERAGEMAFAGGVSVFPGGGLDAADREALAAGLVDEATAAATARSWATTPEGAAALLACAVRETFEETGVLLAGTRPSDGARERLTAREIGLRDVLPRLDAERLRPWARWITPEGMPRRYDTAFFLATVPEGQEPDGATTEAVGAGWCAPAQALREWEDGARALMPPTWAVLSELADAPDTVTLLDRATGRRPEPVTPQFRPGDDRVGLAVPPHAFGAAR
ncbi:NUDIX hydrolase [Actinomycetospora lemnae]|uniref:NUDIX domain-containing protein n=1 Tax=Actinomycetospora lemnae TaxID=3019891 RepID=A0ABT5SUJ0_9PSEU|nr:NUDIX domain-containing protein [Actinomycetospora sp. DW7H6]MDD7966522.1 NUDIX domain-containing protein [Actinomycetospora sp. DW7H6]